MGLGAVAAAAKHEAVDVGKLITWQQGAPVPFAFLAKVRYEAVHMWGTACCANRCASHMPTLQCSKRVSNAEI